MKNFFRKMKNNKGLAIENALLFLIVVFSICALVTILVLIGNNQTKIAKSQQKRQIAVDQIGEDFITALNYGDDLTAAENESVMPSYDGYVTTFTNAPTTVGTVGFDWFALTVKPTGENTTVLYVEALRQTTAAPADDDDDDDKKDDDKKDGDKKDGEDEVVEPEPTEAPSYGVTIKVWKYTTD